MSRVRPEDWTTRKGKIVNNAGHWNTIHGLEGKNTWRQYPALFAAGLEMLTIPDGKLIDLGCGNGVFLALAQKRFPDMELWGLDISSVAILNIVKWLGVEGVVSVLPEIPPPVPPAYFDYVTAFDLVEHIENERELMNNAFRILKPGGLFIMVVPEEHGIGYRKFIAEEDSEHVRWYDEEKVMRVLTHYGEKPGFRVVEDTNIKDGQSYTHEYYLGWSWKPCA
jgi:SAM-dependent methyltransferase